MTSPKITAENKTTANAATAAAATPTDVSNGAVAGTSAPVATAADNVAQNEGPAAGLFSWLKIFRLANLMIKQGC